MITHAQNTTIKEINHRVRSGGFYWKQYNIGKDENGNKSNRLAWYLVSETNASIVGAHVWLINNTSLAHLLGITPKTLSKHVAYSDKNYVYHNDAPIHYVSEDNKPVKRVRQVMWTLEGVKSVLTHSRATINPEVKKHILDWVLEQATKYQRQANFVFDKKEEAPATSVTFKVPAVDPVKQTASLKEPVSDISDSVHHVIKVVEQMWEERNKRRELEDEVTKLKLQLDLLKAKAKPAPVVTKLPGSRFGALSVKDLAERYKQRVEKNSDESFKDLDSSVKDEEEIVDESNVFKHYSSSPPVALSTKETLSDYLSRVSQRHVKVDHLTRTGFLNSDQVYSLFSDFWIDPATSRLIKKAKFQEILRTVFHLKNSTHRTPILKTEMIRDNMAVVAQVTCKKQPNPVDAQGNKLELDNPAYTSNSKKCIRFQVRYTAKGIDYLKKNWYTLLETSSGHQITA